MRFDFRIHWGMSAIYYLATIYVARAGRIDGAFSGFFVATVFFVMGLHRYLQTRPK